MRVRWTESLEVIRDLKHANQIGILYQRMIGLSFDFRKFREFNDILHFLKCIHDYFHFFKRTTNRIQIHDSRGKFHAEFFQSSHFVLRLSKAYFTIRMLSLGLLTLRCVARVRLLLRISNWLDNLVFFACGALFRVLKKWWGRLGESMVRLEINAFDLESSDSIASARC